jgi:hypothetical protein
VVAVVKRLGIAIIAALTFGARCRPPSPPPGPCGDYRISCGDGTCCFDYEVCGDGRTCPADSCCYEPPDPSERTVRLRTTSASP